MEEVHSRLACVSGGRMNAEEHLERDKPATPEQRARAVAKAREALAKAQRPPSRPAPFLPPRPDRETPREVPAAHALEEARKALTEIRQALARLEAALLDYPTETTTKGPENDNH